MNRLAAAASFCAGLYASCALACQPAPAGRDWMVLLTVAGFADTYEWVAPRTFGPKWAPPFTLADGTRVVPLAPDDEDLGQASPSQIAELDGSALACLSAKYGADRIAVVSSYQGAMSIGLWDAADTDSGMQEFSEADGVSGAAAALEKLAATGGVDLMPDGQDNLIEMRLPDLDLSVAETELARIESIALLAVRELEGGGVIVTLRDYGAPGTLSDRMEAAGVSAEITGREEPQEPELPE